jgi:hypothetical protein
LALSFIRTFSYLVLHVGLLFPANLLGEETSCENLYKK